MPTLDKLTTEVSWEVDTSGLDKYEIKISQAETSTASLSVGIATADKEISGISSANIGRLAQDIEIASESVEEISAVAGLMSNAVDGVGESAHEVSIDMDALAVSSNAALQKLVLLAENAHKASEEIDNESRKTAKAAKESKDFDTAMRKLTDDISGFASGMVKIGGLIAGIFTGAGVLASREIGIQARLANSVGMTSDAYLAWDGVLSQMGLSGERVVDMVEETANKLGELQGLGKMSSAQDALKMLGLEFENLKTLKPEEQFREIMSAAKSLEDESVARSATDMIFGGDANKVLGHLRTLDGSLEDILDSYQKYNFLTERGVAGSEALADTLKNIGTAGKTFLAEVTGRLAESLGPVVDQFFDWVTANRQLIDQKIEGVVKSLSTAIRWVGWGAEKIVNLVESMGGIGNTIRGVAVSFAAWKLQSWTMQLSALASKMSLSSAALKGMEIASKGLKAIGLGGLFGAAYLALEDLYYYLTGGKSAIGRFMDENLPKAESAMLHFFGVLDEGMSKQQKTDVTAAFQQGILDGIDRTKSFFGSVDGAMKGVSDAAEYAGIKVANFGASIATEIGAEINLLGGSIAETVSGAIDGATKAFSSFFSGIYEYGKGVVRSINDFVSGIGDSISAFFSGIFDGITSKFKGVIEAIQTAAKNIPLIGGMFESQNFGAPALAMANTGIAGISSGVVSGAPSVPQWAKNTAPSSSIFNMNAPINVSAKTDASPQDIANEVSKALKRNFSDIKTTGIKR